MSGLIWGFGDDAYGQLGQGSTAISRPTPVQILTGSTFKSIAGGSYHSLVILSNNTLWGFGRDDYGQLGQGSSAITRRPTPVQILTGSTFKSIACGHLHSLALRSDNTLWGFGRDDYGQLGQGSTTNSRPTPVQIMSSFIFKSIACGAYHSLALRSDNTLWGFGADDYGQLGQGSTTNSRPTPVQIIEGLSFKAVSCVAYHSLVILSDDTLWGFGRDQNGELGQGSTTNSRPTPVQILAGSTFKAVDGGVYYSLVIRSDDTLWGFGYDYYGQLGQGSTAISRPTPVQILTGSTFKVARGSYHSLAIRSDNTLWGFGRDDYGQLGQGSTTISRPTPIQVYPNNTNDNIIIKDFSGSLWGYSLVLIDAYDIMYTITETDEDTYGNISSSTNNYYVHRNLEELYEFIHEGFTENTFYRYIIEMNYSMGMGI